MTTRTRTRPKNALLCWYFNGEHFCLVSQGKVVKQSNYLAPILRAFIKLDAGTPKRTKSKTKRRKVENTGTK